LKTQNLIITIKKYFLLFNKEGLATFPEIESPPRRASTHWSSFQSAKIIYQKPSLIWWCPCAR